MNNHQKPSYIIISPLCLKIYIHKIIGGIKMELITHKITANKSVCKNGIQTTLEEDMNVPDTKPDIERLIKTQGDLSLTDIIPSENKVKVNGTLSFSLLYFSNDDIRPIHNLKGQIPFSETLNMDNLSSGDDVLCHFNLEDCQASLINSRKISIRAIITIDCCQNEQTENLIGTDIETDETPDTANNGLNKRYETLSYTHMAFRKNDLLRINDEFTLPKGKPTIDTLLYYEVSPQNLQTRITDDGMRITGDMILFALYTPDDEERRLEYIETELPLDSIISCDGCDENMIPSLDIRSTSFTVEPKPDEDGEMRLFDIELNMKILMKFYKNESIDILQDAYSTTSKLELETNNISFERLLIKNQSNMRINEHITLDNNENILQICSSSATIQLDEHSVSDDGIFVEGVINLNILYITENDDIPLALTKNVIPFSHTIEITGITPDSVYELQSGINQINVIMLDSNEIEAKISISLCALVFTQHTQTVITAIKESPVDMESINNMPGLVGFICNDDCVLWDIAKKYNTTIESIMELNDITSENIHKGDKLLIMKDVEGILS